MKEALIILPKQTNEGSSLEAMNDAVLSDIAHEFNGFTCVDALGGYIANGSTGALAQGELKREPVQVVTIATDETDEASAKLQIIAAAYAQRAAQESVYLRDHSGHVFFIERDHSPSVAHLEKVAPNWDEGNRAQVRTRANAGGYVKSAGA